VFYALLALVTEQTHNFPPTRHFLWEVLQLLGDSFVCTSPQEMAKLLSLMLEVSGLRVQLVQTV
jgi:hypothetical protein